MPVIAVIAAVAAVVWAIVYARRGSLLVGCAGLLVVGYVAGHEFWHARLGPMPLTFDRIALVGLVAAFVAQWRWHKLEPKPLALVDWAILALLVVFALSTILNLGGQNNPNSAPPIWRLIASFCIPAVGYWIVRQSRLEEGAWKMVLGVMVAMGIYLALTAFAETARQWWVVFPRYIGNPEMGLHFGRARGPQLNSACLGVYLTATLWCAWCLRTHVRRRWRPLMWAAIPLMAAAVFLTYTRSTWLGLAMSGAVVLWLTLPREWRWPVIGGAGLCGALVVMVAWSHIVGLRREGSAAESQHSVQQRTAFAYVSWQMFKDHPVCGVGFGRFFDRKLPYLADRSQDFELESLRGLDHHNTLLSVLVETGMIGLAALLAVVVAWTRHAWRLAFASDAPDWIRTQGLLMLALLASYLPNALFHDLTLLPADMLLLSIMAGITVGLSQQAFTKTMANRPLTVATGYEPQPMVRWGLTP